MPLVLSLRAGEDFYVGDRQFRLTNVISPNEFEIKDEANGSVYRIADTRATLVMDDVYLSAGEKQAVQAVRITIAAPPEMLVLRGSKYREGPPAKGGSNVRS